MVFIASDCIGARMYEKLNLQFNNPFCWSRISYKDFIFLANNLQNIDFNKIDISLINDPAEGKQHNKVGLVKIDNKLNILYPHYIQSSDYENPTKIDTDVYYNKMNEYILEKYTNRLNRMKLDKKVCLILHHKADREGFDITYNDCKYFIHRKLPFPKILVTHDYSLLLEPNKDTSIIICNENEETGKIAKKIISSMKSRK